MVWDAALFLVFRSGDRLGLEVLDILDASLSRFLPLRVIEHGVPCPYFLQFLTGNVWFCGVYLLPLWSDF